MDHQKPASTNWKSRRNSQQSQTIIPYERLKQKQDNPIRKFKAKAR
jgi:hypothetical protein